MEPSSVKNAEFVSAVIPVVGKYDILREEIDILLDFARAFEYPEFHRLAITLNSMEQLYAKDVLCSELSDEDFYVFESSKDLVILHATEFIQTEAFAKKLKARTEHIIANPSKKHQEQHRKIQNVHTAFNNAFAFATEDSHWYARAVMKSVWKFNNILGDMLAWIHFTFLPTEMREVQFWIDARQVSIIRIAYF